MNNPDQKTKGSIMNKLQLGHVHLKVRNLQRSQHFYQSVFDLDLKEKIGNFVFLTGNHMHQTIALQALGDDLPPAPRRGVGLYHVAFEAGDKSIFATKFRLLGEMGIPVFPIDHVISWAMYFDDPDGNGMEIYTDTRYEVEGSSEWVGENRELTVEEILKW